MPFLHRIRQTMMVNHVIAGQNTRNLLRSEGGFIANGAYHLAGGLFATEMRRYDVGRVAAIASMAMQHLSFFSHSTDTTIVAMPDVFVTP